MKLTIRLSRTKDSFQEVVWNFEEDFHPTVEDMRRSFAHALDGFSTEEYFKRDEIPETNRKPPRV